MDPEQFIQTYQEALGSQDWNVVAPLISKQASVTFSDRTVHRGKNNVQKAFEHNFSQIKGEQYAIKNIQWLAKEKTYAVYLFELYWSGMINDQLVSGNGISTAVIILTDGKWKLLTEHLGKKL